jgi:hypothetical protein
MGFALGELRKAVPGSGIDQPPDIDVLGLLEKAPSPAVEAPGVIRASQPALQPTSATVEAAPARAE